MKGSLFLTLWLTIGHSCFLEAKAYLLKTHHPKNGVEEHINLTKRSYRLAYSHLSPEQLKSKSLDAYLNKVIAPLKKIGEKSGLDGTLLVDALDQATRRRIGFAAYEKNHLTKQNETYLELLVVDPEYWRQGVGSRLTRSIFEFQPSIKSIRLQSRKSNQSACSLYEKLGFLKDPTSIAWASMKSDFVGFTLHRIL